MRQKCKSEWNDRLKEIALFSIRVSFDPIQKHMTKRISIEQAILRRGFHHQEQVLVSIRVRFEPDSNVNDESSSRSQMQEDVNASTPFITGIAVSNP
jgi:hypothetical protein